MRFRLVVNGEAHEVVADGRVTVDGVTVAGEVVTDARGLSVRIGRKRYRLLITRWGSMVEGTPYRLEVRDLEAGETSDAGAAQKRSAALVEVRPPMPGRIVRITVKPGDRVARNAPLAVLEAMKMQNEIPSPVAGRVRELRAKVGDGVLASDVLVVLEPE